MARTYVPTFARQVDRLAKYIVAHDADIADALALLNPSGTQAYINLKNAVVVMQTFQNAMLPTLDGSPQQFIT